MLVILIAIIEDNVHILLSVELLLINIIKVFCLAKYVISAYNSINKKIQL